MVIGITVSCESLFSEGFDITGKWQVQELRNPYFVFEFHENDTFSIHRLDLDSSYNYFYEYSNRDNTILIEYIEKEKYDIIVHSKEEFEIIGFSLSSIPEEMNTLLKKIQ